MPGGLQRRGWSGRNDERRRWKRMGCKVSEDARDARDARDATNTVMQGMRNE